MNILQMHHVFTSLDLWCLRNVHTKPQRNRRTQKPSNIIPELRRFALSALFILGTQQRQQKSKHGVLNAQFVDSLTMQLCQLINHEAQNEKKKQLKLTHIRSVRNVNVPLTKVPFLVKHLIHLDSPVTLFEVQKNTKNIEQKLEQLEVACETAHHKLNTQNSSRAISALSCGKDKRQTAAEWL